jgi:hypothetical protein
MFRTSSTGEVRHDWQPAWRAADVGRCSICRSNSFRTGPTLGEVPIWDKWGQVLNGLSETVPPEAVITSLDVADDLSRVTLWTRTPGLVIGRRGETADRIRSGLSESIGSPIQLFIYESKEPPEEPPSGGVRQPVSPFPVGPTTAAQAEID